LYHYKNFGFNSIETKGKFPPRELNYKAGGVRDLMEYTPFWRQNKILIQDDLVVFTDSQNNASESNLIAVQLEGFHENYK